MEEEFEVNSGVIIMSSVVVVALRVRVNVTGIVMLFHLPSYASLFV